ncbi:MAG: UDP-2,3-diacylglucosamine diphosphatase [Flavobacteriales bacterium]|nr:UDP-2,3-diacylglucosamine diphosphatase [Flavobacteriales bacterium]
MDKIFIDLPEGKKVYFISDMHLGAGGYGRTMDKEHLLLSFLDEIKQDCATLLICGDMFDFWYEWKKVVPKGYVRLLGKLAEYTDKGIPVYFFAGNHDMWAGEYFVKHIGMVQYYDTAEFDISGKRFLVGHGDGLGPGDKKFKLMKWLFKNNVARWLFSHLLHPDIAIGIADYFSRRSRSATGTGDSIYMGDDKEWIYLFCKETEEKEHYDYYVFGHRHLLIDKKIGNDARYVNLGDWLTFYTYGVWNGQTFEIKNYLPNEH